MTRRPRRDGSLNGPWIWLLPATYVVHIAEECLAGERFYRWIHRVVGREIDGRTFLLANVGYEAAMVVAVRRARTHPESAWIVPTLGTLTAANGVGHLAGSVVTRSYSPGVVSGMGLWFPLGLYAVVRARRVLPRTVWRRSVAAGVALNAGVVLVALPLSHTASDPSRTLQSRGVRRPWCVAGCRCGGGWIARLETHCGSPVSFRPP